MSKRIKEGTIESNGSDRMYYIDLPLDSNRAATYFEWKLKISQIGFQKEEYSTSEYRRGRYETVTKCKKIENDVQIGIVCGSSEVLLSSKNGRLYGQGNSIMKLNSAEVQSAIIGK